LNANAIPNDTMPRFTPSGVRLGTPAITSRGLDEKDMVKIADWMLEVVKICAGKRQDAVTDSRLREEVRKMALAHPLPSER
jgi:glycine hydroxymethyltransferase